MKMELERLRDGLRKKGYLLGQQLGRGAFSEVYCVKEKRTGEVYACKISEHADLLQREGQLLGDIRYPQFPEMYESWREESVGFLVMELVEGENLGEVIRGGGTFSVKRTAEIGMELADGLLYLHDRPSPILFRDIKPDNIMIQPDGCVKLIDFGCACALGKESASKAGTPGFAAPEQLSESGGQTTACDVYGLGRTLLCMLGAGEGDRSGKQLLRVLEACTREEPKERPADMRAVITALLPLVSPNPGSRLLRGRGGLLPKGVVCEKNIRKSTYKNS